MIAPRDPFGEPPIREGRYGAPICALHGWVHDQAAPVPIQNLCRTCVRLRDAAAHNIWIALMIAAAARMGERRGKIIGMDVALRSPEIAQHMVQWGESLGRIQDPWDDLVKSMGTIVSRNDD